jgi:hypothetical protein
MFDGVGAASSKESRAAELTKLPLLVRLANVSSTANATVLTGFLVNARISLGPKLIR